MGDTQRIVNRAASRVNIKAWPSELTDMEDFRWIKVGSCIFCGVLFQVVLHLIRLALNRWTLLQLPQ